MKDYVQDFKSTIKPFFTDRINLYLLGTAVVLFVADFIIWTTKLRYESIYIQSISGVYPIRFLVIILSVNSILAIFSSNKEKEISYLLLGANIFLSLLIFVLEIFYFVSLNYG